jgi:hypothetical protein
MHEEIPLLHPYAFMEQGIYFFKFLVTEIG